jgi:hypothetical protein
LGIVMADTKTPKHPLGTVVRGRLAGWEASQEDDYDASYEQGLDVVPSFDGCPEFVEGPLEGQYVQVTKDAGYFKHVVDGYDVDPETLEVLEEPPVVASASNVKRQDSQRLMDIDRDLRTKLYVAMNDHMGRALERAGAKIRTKLSKTASGRQWLTERPCTNGVLARVAPATLLAAGGLEESMLLQTAWDELRPVWFEYVANGDTSLLRQIARMTGIDINTLSAQEVALREASEEGWVFAQQRLDELAKGYLSDSATVVAIDEVVTSDLVDMGTVRQSVAVAGGSGVQDPTSAGLLVGDDMSIGVTPQLSTGPVSTKTLKGADLEIDSYEWVHGFTPNPFAPHLALHGVEFLTWQDPQLFNEDEWPQYDYFIPGDHKGCQCDYYINWSK